MEVYRAFTSDSCWFSYRSVVPGTLAGPGISERGGRDTALGVGSRLLCVSGFAAHCVGAEWSLRQRKRPLTMERSEGTIRSGFNRLRVLRMSTYDHLWYSQACHSGTLQPLQEC